MLPAKCLPDLVGLPCQGQSLVEKRFALIRPSLCVLPNNERTSVADCHARHKMSAQHTSVYTVVVVVSITHGLTTPVHKPQLACVLKLAGQCYVPTHASRLTATLCRLGTIASGCR